ncbi:hypothetical protein C9412_15685 [Stenotrophomonas sp. Nf1]|nr:hypothetical protein C9412_15685 [Stenotrophomonas sp. Nf1]PTA81326.1 hypothetical protein C9416_09130 [Stenotrophomonas sp. Nf4]
MRHRNQPPAAAIVVRDRDNVAMNVYHVPVRHHVEITFTMRGGNDGKTTQLTKGLPYVVVHARPEDPSHWRVLERPRNASGKTSSQGKAHVLLQGAGKYRIYINEPTEQFLPRSTFSIQQHALADGRSSGRDVQPLVELDVIEAADLSLSVRTTHPNGLLRTRGVAADSIAADGVALQLTSYHEASSKKVKPLDLGRHLISFQAWADASRTYGSEHPLIEASDYREQLRIIYGERLTMNSAHDAHLHDRIFEHGDKRIEFNHQSTTGGRGRLSFREDNGHAGNRMTADESLRRTHPAAMEFLLRMMHDLDISHIRSTGAWRPHFGSVLHRYASALDITKAEAAVADNDGRLSRVEVRFHRELGKECNPIPPRGAELDINRRRRELSFRVHAYIAQAKQNGALGWIGGPWRLTNDQLGIAQPPGQGALAFATDDTHVHHIHISLGYVES